MEGSFLHPTQTLRAAGVTEGMCVADFGAGSGFFTRAAARLVGPIGVVWAIDVHRDLLTRVKNLGTAEGLSNIEIAWGDVALPKGSHLPAQSCDLVLITNILFMLESKREVLHEAARVLKPQGQILLIDWTSSHDGLGPHPDHIFTEAAARTVCEQEGFSVLRPVPAGAYHWGLIVRKNMTKDAQ